MAGTDEGTRVCVTGGSGYIGSWIVKLLLDRGYTVNATVKSLNDPNETEHLLALDGAEERLHLFEASLLEEGSFDSPIQGCHGVLHTASPVKVIAENPQEEIIDPAVKGTLNVLSSCAKNPSIRRVVVTSSMASVMLTGRPLTPEVVVDETWFSLPEFCEQSPWKWYDLSKTLAEEAAWKFVKENGIDMVSIHPGMVIGPLLQPTLNSSPTFFMHIIRGTVYDPNARFGWVNVKDVANAHILAFETLSANGRYLLSESVAYISEIVKILNELYPTLTVPDKSENEKPSKATHKVSKEKVQSLGINYIPLKTSIKETVESLKEKNFISF